MTITSDLLAMAIEHHQDGRLPAAEQLYHQILQLNPNHVDALHLLGVLAHQVGNHVAAIEFINRSIRLNPNESHVHNNLGGAYRALNRYTEAVSCFRRAVELQPDSAETQINLGNVLMDLGNLDEAVSCFRNAVELKPKLAIAHLGLAKGLKGQAKIEEAVTCYNLALDLHPADFETLINLGNLLKEQGKLGDAVVRYRQAIELVPSFAVAHLNLGVVLKELGKVDEAIVCYRRGLELKPDFAEAFNNLGVALTDREQPDEAIACYRKALELKSDYADAHNNLGNALHDRGNLNEAVICYRKALEIQPGFVKAHNNLGVVLKGQGKLGEAILCYWRSLQLNPDDPEALGNLGDVLRTQGKLDDAVSHCRRALELNPNSAEGFNRLGNALKDQGKLDEAIACYRRAIEIKPNFVDAHSNLIYTRLFFHGGDRQSLFDDHRRWNECHARSLSITVSPHTNDRTSTRRLRVGYVSPDFRNHVVGRNLLPLFREHDHRRFEIYCYAHVPSPDELTGQFRDYSDVFHNTTGMTDLQIAQRIRDDRIDILVDLTLHMALNRLLVFARKPAPVQVTFAGYPGTTGLTTIDYRLTDPHLDPPNFPEDCYSEKSIRLPDSFWCYDPLNSEATVSPLPADKNGHITFGCLNNFCKVNATVLKIWAQVLRSNEGSRLVLLSGEGSHRQHVLDILADLGIARTRVTFVCNQRRQQYLLVYQQIDIGLDTVPYNGHTTSLDAFWMGVPVVTLVGETVTGRAGVSQLMNLGLPELIAECSGKYVKITTELAYDLPRLRQLRGTLRERMQASPLMDAPRFARSIETAYREMWRRWCEESVSSLKPPGYPHLT